MVHYYDTSSILNGDYPNENGYISSIVIEELENIKTSFGKDEEVKYRARKAVNFLSSGHFHFLLFSNKELDLLKKYGLPDTNDNRILVQALFLSKKVDDEILFHTEDLCLSLTCRIYNIETTCLSTSFEKDVNELYGGWSKHYLTEQELNVLYTDSTINSLKVHVNEYCEIFDGVDTSKMIDLCYWNGTEYISLKYKPVKNEFMGTIGPINTEQKMLFNLLQNKDIKIKTALGHYGVGKSYIMIANALDMVMRGQFDKIIFVRNNIDVKDTKDLGSLPGDLYAKALPWVMPIADHVGGIDALEELYERGLLEVVPLNYLRGRDFKRSIIFCDECENMTKEHIQLLIGRIAKGTELWLAGDLKQRDKKIFEQNSGLRILVERLAGKKLFGVVKLIKGERDEAASYADFLD